MPALQSFAWGTHDGRWFLIGGRTDGLHRRQPPFAFLSSGNNLSAYVVDPLTHEVWSATLDALPQSLLEQLQSTNMEFDQRGGTLYCIGGYGYSVTASDHITYPNLAAIDLAGVMDAIQTGGPISPWFRQITDDRMEVTGGQLRLINDRFHLVGGQRFIGRYNPQGPDFGPGFIQEYTNAVRRFDIADDGVELSIEDYWEHVDTVNLHRRDYNMLPQIFSDGSEGLTVFSGVFQYAEDVPWLNTVDIRDTSITVVPGFEQLLNQYHTAHVGLYHAGPGRMRSLFFGGMARYHFDTEGVLMDDMNVPFVNTISAVQRDSTGELTEAIVGSMPALLGASAEFIPWPGTPQNMSGILFEHEFVGDTVVLGHIVGGIESTAANIFFINTGAESQASSRILRAMLVSAPASLPDAVHAGPGLRLVREGDRLSVALDDLIEQRMGVRVMDSIGRVVLAAADQPCGKGAVFGIDLRGWAEGTYTIEVRMASRNVVARFIR